MDSSLVNIMSYSIATSLESISIKDKTIVNTINPHSYCVSKKDKTFEDALKASDLLVPDGDWHRMGSKNAERKIKYKK